MGEKILITGGVRSGKSSYALERADGEQGDKFFIATAEPSDNEMKERIRHHRKERKSFFTTIEEPLRLGERLAEVQQANSVIVIDCLTLWVSNCLLQLPEEDYEEEINSFIKILEQCPATVVMVTNEVGLGIIPTNALARKYSDVLGRLNQQIAKRSDEVIMLVSGIPLFIKKGASFANPL